MFFRRKDLKADRLQGKRIGILGLASGNGTTHIAVALSNYLADRGRKRVCLMEKNNHDDLEPLIISLGAPEGDASYEFHRVTYICSRGMSDEEKMLDASYDCMVFDLGTDMAAAMKTLCICDIRIVVGTGAVWRRSEYDALRRLSQRMGGLNNWILLVNLGNEYNCSELMDYGIPMFCFPFEKDPVYPDEITSNVLEAVVLN